MTIQRVARWVSLALVCAGPACLVAEEVEGLVRRIAGKTLLIETANGLEVVTLARGGSLTGAVDMLRIVPGDSVRATWSRQMAGVKLAEELAVAPLVMTDPELWLEIGEFRQLMVLTEDASPVTVVDARSRERFNSGHIPGALTLPVEDVEAFEAGLPADKALPLIFYSEGPRCGLAQRAVRLALGQGYVNARSLRGGLQVWAQFGGSHLEVEAAYFSALGERKITFTRVDVRPGDFAGDRTLPGAVHVPLETMSRGEFLGARWMPPYLFVGTDSDDPRSAEAADRVISWRSTDQNLSQLPVSVLAGGIEAWTAVGNETVPLQTAPKVIAFPYDREAGQVTMEEFLQLWADRMTGEGLLLDARSPIETPIEGTLHLPVEELHERLAELPHDRPIVTFCYSGNRSAITQLVLARLGYDVRYLPMTPQTLR